MENSTDSYLLANNAAELDRLRLQARVWEPDAEAMLDRIGLPTGASCVDLGCGAMGILGPLSRRVGPTGRVVGADIDLKQLAGARDYVLQGRLANVEIFQADAYKTGFPRDSFDLVHVRFVFAPVGRDTQLLREMVALTRPGGVIVVQEPEAATWNCYPQRAGFTRLKETILATFARGGGDFNVGQRTYGMLRKAGLQNVQVRAAVIALQDRHAYLRLPVQFAGSLRPRILASGLLSEAELDEAIAECERVADDPETFGTTFTLIQAWGRKPVTK